MVPSMSELLIPSSRKEVCFPCQQRALRDKRRPVGTGPGDAITKSASAFPWKAIEAGSSQFPQSITCKWVLVFTAGETGLASLLCVLCLLSRHLALSLQEPLVEDGRGSGSEYSQGGHEASASSPSELEGSTAVENSITQRPVGRKHPPHP